MAANVDDHSTVVLVLSFFHICGIWIPNTTLQDKRLRCQKDGVFVEGRRSEVLLAKPNPNSSLNKDGVPLEQVWELQTQRPGSGILDVECLHKGPTLVGTDLLYNIKAYEAYACNDEERDSVARVLKLSHRDIGCIFFLLLRSTRSRVSDSTL